MTGDSSPRASGGPDRTGHNITTPALVARDLYRFYRSETEEVVALRRVSLEVQRGEIVAIVGPSGSGKSTLLACLAGIDDPDAGVVLVDGERMSHRPELERSALRASTIGLVFQDRNLIEHLTARENVMLAMRIAGIVDGARASAELEKVGLRSRESSRPSQLSGGEATRVAVATAMASLPIVLIADEPTAEVDADTQRSILATLRAFAGEGGAVVVASHSATVADAADRVLHLIDGELRP